MFLAININLKMNRRSEDEGGEMKVVFSNIGGDPNHFL